jgi:hypothetical protein
MNNARLLSIAGILLMAHSALGAVDLSSPKSTAKSFYEAMNNADSSAMRDCLLVDGEDQQQLASAFLDVILSGKKLADAAKEKFGPSGEKLAAGALAREDASAIDSATQTDDGDVSTLQIDKQRKPLKFRKTSAGWKLILIDYAAEKKEDLSAQIKLLTNLAAAMNDTANDINEGRFPTTADAEAAIQQRFSEVMVKRYKPATTQAK